MEHVTLWNVVNNNYKIYAIEYSRKKICIFENNFDSKLGYKLGEGIILSLS